MDNVCFVKMWSVCLLGVWGARSVWSVWSVRVGRMCVSGWPIMAHSPRQEQDPATPTSSLKTVPRSRASDVSLESRVGTIEQGFGAAKLLQVAKGAPLVVGWAHFAKTQEDHILYP